MIRKIAALALAGAMSLTLLAGCGGAETEISAPSAEEPTSLIVADTLRIQLPSTASAAAVDAATPGFSRALTAALKERGYAVSEIALSVGATDASAGKALADNAADIAVLPASQYFAYSDTAQILMTATIPAADCDSGRAADWSGAHEYGEKSVPYGRTLICATATAAGRELAARARSGKLTWDSLSAARWMLPKTSVSSDFLYPDLWLQSNFGTTTAELTGALSIDGYAALMTEASLGDADVVVLAADQRIDYAEAWQLSTTAIDATGKMGLGQSESIFDDLTVIGVSDPIYGDVLAAGTGDPVFGTPAFHAALTAALLALQEDEDARALYAACGYTGFVPSDAADYDNIRDLVLADAGD